MLAQAHLERRLSVGGEKDPAHLRRPEVRDELAGAARESVLHPGFRGVRRSVEAHGYFAAVFGLAGEHALAAPHFRALNGYASEFPRALLRSLTSLGRGTACKRLRRRAARAGGWDRGRWARAGKYGKKMGWTGGGGLLLFGSP
ncbi:hypothetical protein [Kitasatospora sp. NPDC004272]